MAEDKGNSKADTLVKVVLVFFIALLSFSVGTFVGKQVSDSDHRRMALEGEYKAERQVASADHHAEAEESGDKISEKEVESLTEEFVNKESGRMPASVSSDHGDHHADADHGKDTHAAAGQGEAAHGETATHHAEQKDAKGYKTYARNTKPEAHKVGGNEHGDKHEAAPAPAAAAHGDHSAPAKATSAKGPDAAQKVAEKVAAGHAPTDGKKEAAKAKPTLPTMAKGAVGKYAVQVAAYPDEKEAKTHAADLKGKGYEAFYISATVNGHTWYRVLVGLFDSIKNADEYRAQLMKETGSKSAMVQKIVQ